MIKRFSLRFSNNELEQRYLKHRTPNIYLDYLTFTVLIQLFLLLQLVYSVQVYNLSMLGSIIAFSVTEGVSLLVLRKNIQYIDQILPVMQFFVALTLDYLSRQTEGLTSDDLWCFNLQSAIWHIVIYLQGAGMFVQSCILILNWSTLIIFGSFTTIQYFCLFEVLIGIIVFRFVIEQQRRETFISYAQNEQWNKLIEDVVPSWMVILSQNKESFLRMEKANKKFINEFGIRTDFDFRGLIRNLQIFPLSTVQNGVKPAIEKRLDYEKHLLKQLSQEHNFETKLEEYYGFLPNKQKKDSDRTLHISSVKFQALQPLLLLIFREVNENIHEPLQRQIEWRDRLITQMCQKNMIAQSSVVSFLRVLNVHNSKYVKYLAQFWQEINKSIQDLTYKGYLAFNTSLNSFTMLQLSQRDITLQCDSISVKSLQFQLESELRIGLIVKNKPKLLESQNPKRGFLRRAQQTQQTKVFQDTFTNDRQRIMQILISLVELIELLLSLKPKRADLHKLKMSVKEGKKLNDCLAIRLYHPDLQIPAAIDSILNQNWSGSDQNQQRWGVSEHIDIISKLEASLTEIIEQSANPKERRGQIKKLNCLPSLGLPLAQYLISQIGPRNVIFFKRKEYKSETQNELLLCFDDFDDTPIDPTSSNQIKFLVYKDLEEKQKELNQVLDSFAPVRPGTNVTPTLDYATVSPNRRNHGSQQADQFQFARFDLKRSSS